MQRVEEHLAIVELVMLFVNYKSLRHLLQNFGYAVTDN